MFPLQLGQWFEPHGIGLYHEKYGREQTHRRQVNYSQSFVSAVNTYTRRANLLGVRPTSHDFKSTPD